LRREAQFDRNLVIGFHVAALIAFAWSGYLVEYLVLWILPLVTVVQAILRLRAIAEHGATRDFSSPLTAARTNLGPAWLRWALFPHNVNYHIEHHLYASVPQHNLPELHREMAKRGMLAGAEVVAFAWSGYLVEYLVLWILPLATVVQAILRLRAIAEHGATTDFSSPLTAARTNLGPAWLRWALFPHNVGYHIEHHLYASVPQHNLPRLHAELRRLGVLEGAEVMPFRATLGKIFANPA
jgi:fatty acid desaturase